MASPKIKFKRSAVASKRPSLSSLELGELALNTYDGKLFTRRDTSGVGIATTVSTINPWTENYGSSAIEYGGNISVTGVSTFSDDVDVTGNLAVDTNTLFVNATNNRIGIGTDNPAYQVEIENTGANALLVLDRTDGAACFIEGQATRSAFGSVNATPLALAYNSFAVVTIGAGGSIRVNPDGDGYTFPTTDGSANQVLQTDGEGNLSFADVTGAGAASTSNVSSNTTISGIITASSQFYPPTLTTAERDALSVNQGALIFNATENKVQMYLGSEWKSLAFELDTYTSIGI